MVITIKGETHEVKSEIYEQRGNCCTGNITAFFKTDDPDILYRKDYKEWEFYTECFVRRDQI